LDFPLRWSVWERIGWSTERRCADEIEDAVTHMTDEEERRFEDGGMTEEGKSNLPDD